MIYLVGITAHLLLALVCVYYADDAQSRLLHRWLYTFLALIIVNLGIAGVYACLLWR